MTAFVAFLMLLSLNFVLLHIMLGIYFQNKSIKRLSMWILDFLIKMYGAIFKVGVFNFCGVAEVRLGNYLW